MENEELDLLDIMELMTVLEDYCRQNGITSMTRGNLSIQYAEPAKVAED